MRPIFLKDHSHRFNDVYVLCFTDVRDLVELEDVMEAEDLRLGPNGGLVFCME